MIDTVAEANKQFLCNELKQSTHTLPYGTPRNSCVLR